MLLQFYSLPNAQRELKSEEKLWAVHTHKHENMILISVAISKPILFFSVVSPTA